MATFDFKIRGVDRKLFLSLLFGKKAKLAKTFAGNWFQHLSFGVWVRSYSAGKDFMYLTG